MKRSPMPRRKRGLSSRAESLPASRQLVRRVQLRQRSSRKVAEQSTRSRLAREVERRGGRPLCQIRWDRGCTVWADDWDERRSRAAGGSPTDLTNAQWTCRHCHELKHTNPAEARARGFTLLSSDPDPTTELTEETA